MKCTIQVKRAGKRNLFKGGKRKKKTRGNGKRKNEEKEKGGIRERTRGEPKMEHSGKGMSPRISDAHERVATT